MFRVKETAADAGFSSAEWILQITLVLALLANLASAYLILQEYHRLGTWLDSPESNSPTNLASLHRQVGVQFISSLIVLTVLVSSVVASRWLRQRYLSSQQSLHRVKMLAHDILASMDRGVITTNQEGVITSINSAGIHLMDVGFDCVGQPLVSICSDDVSLVDVYQHVTECQTPVLDHDFTLHRAGQVLRLRVDGHVLKDFAGTAVGCVIHLRDVTSRLLMEERMRRMERFLSLATLASGLHHEIKNPLTALSIHVQLLEESLSNGPSRESLMEFVTVLKTEVCRLNGVLESFRSFANFQHLTIQPTDAFAVVENAINLIRPQAAEQQIQITLMRPEKELPSVPLDADRFQQALLNLVINGVEAMPQGGHLTISVAADGSEFRVSVKDSGPGIPSEIQQNLFQPYFSTKSQGTGLGLALSEKLISQHGGHIDYRTSPDGTTFDIAIPLEQTNGNACTTTTFAS